MKQREGQVYFHEQLVGHLKETESGYRFEYTYEYFNSNNSKAISMTLPLKQRVHESKVLFPFFDGLIPEGWLLDIAQQNWKLNYQDRMGLLLACCKDCIGAVGIFEA